MVPKIALILLTLLSPWLLVGLMFGGAGLVWVGAPMICALPVLLIAVGTQGRRPPLGALLGIWLLLSGSWLAIGWLSSSSDLANPSPNEAGVVVALMLLGLGLAPLLWVGWLFARSFSDEGLSPEALQRLRQEKNP